jgi:short chain dehydrogenase
MPHAATVQELGVMGEPLPANRSQGTTADRMKGKVCLVTGGGSGIGRATALKMAEEGAAAVLIAGRREAEIEKAAAECRTLGSQSLAIRTDVTRENDVERLVGTAVERYGPRRSSCKAIRCTTTYSMPMCAPSSCAFAISCRSCSRAGRAGSWSMHRSAGYGIRTLDCRSIPRRKRRRSP